MTNTDHGPQILVVNGPNLNLLGARQPGIYGTTTLDSIVRRLEQVASSGPPTMQIIPFQSNHEGDIIDFLQEQGPAAAGIIINAGAFTHYSYAIRDCLANIPAPAIEVHISNIHAREEFRHYSVMSSIVAGQIVGLGTYGYNLALEWHRERLAAAGNGGLTQ